MTQPTKLPWKRDGTEIYRGETYTIAEYTTEEDAEYSLTACNAYPELIELVAKGIYMLTATDASLKWDDALEEVKQLYRDEAIGIAKAKGVS